MALSKGFAATAAGAAGESPVLLVVDDEREVTAAIADQLRRQCRVVAASSAEEALRLLESCDVSVIVSDQRMPQLSGSEFLRQASLRFPDATRLLLTGYSDLEAVVKAVNEGQIFFYLAKPWSAPELEAVVTRAIEHNHLLRERRALVEELREANAGLERRVTERTRELEEANRRIGELALVALLLDIDHFKAVNDDFGHPIGDAVLAAVGDALAKSLRPYDVAARYGGEEFLLLLPATGLAEGLAAAERIRKTVAALRVPGCPRAVTASVGVASLVPGEAPESLVARADAALYRAKTSGRNRVEGAAVVPEEDAR